MKWCLRCFSSYVRVAIFSTKKGLENARKIGSVISQKKRKNQIVFRLLSLKGLLHLLYFQKALKCLNIKNSGSGLLCNTRHWKCFLSFLLLRMARMHVDWNLKKKGKGFFSTRYLQSSIKNIMVSVPWKKLCWSRVCMNKGTFISNDLWTNLALKRRHPRDLTLSNTGIFSLNFFVCYI